MSSTPFKYQIPNLFRRVTNSQHPTAKHFIALRERKGYRQEQNSVLVQGAKTIKELRDKGFKIRSLVITVKKNVVLEEEIKNPSYTIVKHPESFPADEYYATDIDVARRILGTASRPGNHDMFAEIPIVKSTMKLNSKDKLLVFDQIKDPGNLGTLVRTGCALGWDSGLITNGSCDLFNDKTIRASRALTLSWQHEVMSSMGEMLKYLKNNGFTPIVADMLPVDTTTTDLWSPSSNNQQVKPGTGVWFWNFQNKPRVIPKKMALILCSEHHGVNKVLMNELKVSVPMDSTVESLNVANVGGIIMDNLNRYSYQQTNVEKTFTKNRLANHI